MTYSLLRGNYTNCGQLLPQLMLKYFHGYKLITEWQHSWLLMLKKPVKKAPAV